LLRACVSCLAAIVTGGFLGDADQHVECLDCLRFDGFQLADVAKHVTEGANPFVSVAANNKIDKHDKQYEYA
jgi:hypothetical protein